MNSAHRVRYTPALVWLALLVFALVVQATLVGVLTNAMTVGIAVTTAVQLAAAVALVPFLSARKRVRLAALMVLVAVILAAPFLITEDARALRFITACASVLLVMKLWDLHVEASRGYSVSLARLLPFLLNVFSIVMRGEDAARRPQRRAPGAELLRALAASGAGLLGIAALYQIRWRGLPLLVEHGVKALVIFLAILAFLHLLISIVRLAGGTMHDFADAPLLARTPADFWRRYNRVFHRYFHQNVFRPLGGRRSPVVLVLLIFAISALIHEYAFGIAIGRVQGYQTAFFMLQGIGVAATLRVKPRTRIAITAWTAGTLAFNLVTSMLFFLSFHAVVRIYANPIPNWLRW
jgi:hypothetical protein